MLITSAIETVYMLPEIPAHFWYTVECRVEHNLESMPMPVEWYPTIASNLHVLHLSKTGVAGVLQIANEGNY